MTADPNSVFSGSATLIECTDSTRIAGWNDEDDDITYVSLVGDVTVITSDVTPTVSIDDTAKHMGIRYLQWNPSASTIAETPVFKTAFMSKIKVNVDDGDVVAPSHAISLYAQSVYEGDGTIDYGFGIEGKLSILDAETTVQNYSEFKPAIGPINGDLTNYTAFDADIDFSGIDGTATNTYSLNSPRTTMLAVQKGGLLTAAKFLVAPYTVTVNDANNTLFSFGSGAIDLTVPASLPDGLKLDLIQGLTTDPVTPIASGGNTIFNVDSHTKTGGQFAATQINVITGGSGGVTIFSGRTAA